MTDRGVGATEILSRAGARSVQDDELTSGPGGAARQRGRDPRRPFRNLEDLGRAQRPTRASAGGDTRSTVRWRKAPAGSSGWTSRHVTSQELVRQCALLPQISSRSAYTHKVRGL